MYRQLSSENGNVAIIDGIRTPTGRLSGALSEYEATDLGRICLEELEEHVDPQDVDEVILGSVIQAGQGQAPARQALLNAGWSPKIPAVTINKVCGSGMKAILQGTEAIRGGPVSQVIAGGMESMTNAPHLLADHRKGQKMGSSTLKDAAVYDGLWCSIETEHMGQPAERIAERYDLSRKELDEFALRSHRLAAEAHEEGQFESERIDLPELKRDEPVRHDTDMEQLGSLQPAFRENGVVTAGNAPGLNDGACVLSVAAEKSAEAIAKRRNIKSIFAIEGYSVVGMEPGNLFESPAAAVELLLESNHWTLDDFDRIEFNEAFASQVLGNCHRLELNPDRINRRGGAVALGHPIGMSGSRIVLTLLDQLRESGEELGLAAICMGGGNGIAIVIQQKEV